MRHSFVPLQHAPRIERRHGEGFFVLFNLCLCLAHKHTQADLFSITDQAGNQTRTVCLIIV